MYPIRLNPAYQHYVWGGERIRTYFHRDLEIGRYAESWEVSDRNEGMSFIANGPWQGRSLRDVLDEEAEKILGKHKHFKEFPLLIKIIDSKENLSLQVHPDKDAANKWGGEPKSELWIALERSEVFVGLKPGVTKQYLAQAINDNKVEPLLNKIVLEKGESIYVPAGEVHAICAGAFLLEVQQNSNTTYRLYDWGRIGRQLHLEEGFACIHFQTPAPHKLEMTPSQSDGHHRLDSLLVNEYFVVERLEIRDRWQFKAHRKSFEVLFCIQGKAMLENESISPGTTFLIPPSSSSVSIHGSCQLILVRLP